MDASQGGGVLAGVRQQLAAGMSDEAILDALAAKGLSRASAERFLQRARPAAPEPPPLPLASLPVPPRPIDAPPPIPEAPIVPRTAAAAAPGQGWRLAAIGGAVATALALAAAGVVLTVGAPRTAPAAPAATADATTLPDRRAEAPRHATAARDAVVAQHVERLQGTRAGDPCQAAVALADLGAREQVPALLRFLDASTADEHRLCGADALVRLGEGAAVLPQYVAWAQAESDRLVHGAIVGLGRIGPSAAHEAVPLLRSALTRNPPAPRRLAIVSTLASLGPSAAPSLQLLVDDEDAQVRTAAQRALERLR